MIWSQIKGLKSLPEELCICSGNLILSVFQCLHDDLINDELLITIFLVQDRVSTLIA